ncbi:hypothetical protein AA14337_3217 [Acetobacter malorum DSM 14337]|uniref:Uncharacterized protein n=1 Tax=Acetobacter malorum DSM 14337 TaxID=1307910 RepID=A0ABQ0Q0A9_9PROT|nr:hypothetical protein [Acetobacter malorum]GBQ86001.1 hypothetical protein AA14337_3217 [Acetobacter malorum DSM 14337]
MSNGPDRFRARGVGGSHIRKGGGGASPGNGLNILVGIDSYHNLDDQREENRYVIASLLHDVPEWGMKAEFDPNGMPTTKIEVNMPPNGVSERRGIRDLNRPVGGGMPIDEGGIVAFEKCNFTQATQGRLPHVSAGFSRGLATSADLHSGRKIPMFETMTAVLPEKKRRLADGSVVPSRDQSVVSLMPDHAIRITSPNDLGNFLMNLIREDPSRPGHPGVAVIANRTLPADPSQAAQMAANPQTRYGKLMTVFPQNVSPQGAPPKYALPNVQSVMDKLAEDAGLFSAVGSPEWEVYAVPVVHNRLPKSLVFSQQAGRNVRDLSDPYSIYTRTTPESVRPGSEFYLDGNNQAITKQETGFSMTQSMVAYMSVDPTNRGPAMRTYARPMRQTGVGYATPDLVSIHDIVTPFTHEAHRAAVDAVKEKTFEIGRSFTQMRSKARKGQSYGQPQQSQPPAPQQNGWGPGGGAQPQYGQQPPQAGGWGGQPQQAQPPAPQQNGWGPGGGAQPQHSQPQAQGGGWGGQPQQAQPPAPQQNGWGPGGGAQPHHTQPQAQGGGWGGQPQQAQPPAPQHGGWDAPPSQGDGGWEPSDPGWGGEPIL